MLEITMVEVEKGLAIHVFLKDGKPDHWCCTNNGQPIGSNYPGAPHPVILDLGQSLITYDETIEGTFLPLSYSNKNVEVANRRNCCQQYLENQTDNNNPKTGDRLTCPTCGKMSRYIGIGWSPEE